MTVHNTPPKRVCQKAGYDLNLTWESNFTSNMHGRLYGRLPFIRYARTILTESFIPIQFTILIVKSENNKFFGRNEDLLETDN